MVYVTLFQFFTYGVRVKDILVCVRYEGSLDSCVFMLGLKALWSCVKVLDMFRTLGVKVFQILVYK